MYRSYFIAFLLLNGLNLFAINYEELSQDFLYAVRVEDDHSSIALQLSQAKESDLVNSLNSEAKKKAFWLNIYNAFIQIKAKAYPGIIQESRNDFFTNSWIKIAGYDMSFDDIEHGMLRNSQWKYGMGYIGAWFPREFEKSLRVNEIDYRIHFALNCGAAGCPPIAFYSADKLDEQLDIATQGFMELNTLYNRNKNTVEVSKILSWFKGDFGGNSGILDLLKSTNLVEQESNPKLLFKEYDWTLSIGNYIE
jgi:hypothetical protein